MKHEKLNQALDHIDDRFIEEAAVPKKKGFPWVRSIAAVLAVALIAGLGYRLWPQSAEKADADAGPHWEIDLEDSFSTQHRSYALATAEYPKMAVNPYSGGNYETWQTDQRRYHDQPAGYADNLHSYFGKLIPSLLQGSGEQNVTCSPVNIYMALAMLAQTTGGQSQQQLLQLLQADSMDALRAQAGQVWQAHYNDDGLTTSILGNSLWLHQDATYNEDTVQLLSDSFYASVFRGPLGTKEMNDALGAWLNEQTGGLLQEQARKVELSPESNLALASTILYQVQWLEDFDPEKNTEATFHGAAGDSTQTFMNKQLSYGPYFWSDRFGAVYLPLEDGSRMWLLLPDEGVKPEDILEEAGAFLAQDPAAYESSYENQKPVVVELSLPKFDICSEMDLADRLKGLGVTDVFTPGVADFSPILPQDDGGYVDQVLHATRVAVDEEGVTAAAFTVINRCGAGMPPTEEIRFVLDHPFLFYIESADGLPLFTGIVNQP